MAVGAGIALAELADHLGLTVSVVGTLAEEVGDNGGKVALSERRMFDDTYVVMMVHPAPYDVAEPKIIAAFMFEVNYTGKEAHAAAFIPSLNTADALTIGAARCRGSGWGEGRKARPLPR